MPDVCLIICHTFRSQQLHRGLKRVSRTIVYAAAWKPITSLLTGFADFLAVGGAADGGGWRQALTPRSFCPPRRASL